MGVDDWPQLSAGTAGAWWMTLPGTPGDCWGRWASLLDAEERARAGRFVHEHDRRQFIAAHALLRLLLQRFGGRPATSWRFVTGAHGKPSLHPDHGLAPLAFNISHTRDAIACAMTLDHEIGVDIEALDRPGRLLEIAGAYFSAAELSILRAARSDEQRTVFLRLWTLKEAYIKAHGDGLSLPLKLFSFSLSPLKISFAGDLKDDPQRWTFATFAAAENHVLSTAVRQAGAAPVDLMALRVNPADIARFL